MLNVNYLILTINFINTLLRYTNNNNLIVIAFKIHDKGTIK